MAVSKRLRYEILRRDNHTCRYCGASAPDVPLRVDHVTAVALGGTDKPDNLVTSCEPCNNGKSSSTVDATVVADVSSDALRWADAMKQAAAELAQMQKPKLEYRAAFQSAWNGWTYERGSKKIPHDLPTDWKNSLDQFREAGLPVEVLPDIVDKAMANKTVRSDNLFRYCCGIAWRMIGELQDRAKRITGAVGPDAAPNDSVVQAAVDVWMHEQFGEIDSERREQFRISAIEARKDEDAHRIVEAGQYAAWYGEAEVGAALAKLDRENALQKWSQAWLTQAGEYPDEKRTQYMEAQINTLLAAGVYVERVSRAAVYAGSRRNALLHFGLGEEEQNKVGVSAYIARAIEVWAEAFQASADRWPTSEERSAFLSSLQRVGTDGDLWIADVHQAAAAAGAYQDSDISTCLTWHLSVFEAAARPLAPAA